jgi:hypothetical protein
MLRVRVIMLRVRVIGIAVVRYPRETEFLIKSLADLFMDTPLFNAHTTVHSLTCAADRLDCRSSACAAVTAADSSIPEAENRSAANVHRRLRCKGGRPSVTAGRACHAMFHCCPLTVAILPPCLLACLSVCLFVCLFVCCALHIVCGTVACRVAGRGRAMGGTTAYHARA